MKGFGRYMFEGKIEWQKSIARVKKQLWRGLRLVLLTSLATTKIGGNDVG